MGAKPEGFAEFQSAMGKLSKIFPGMLAARESIIQGLVGKDGGRPQKLYHYTSLQGARGIIQSANLWATEAQFMNDSTELLYGYSLLAEELTSCSGEFCENERQILRDMARFVHDHGEQYRAIFETYVISFSEQPDMLGQWRAYADQASGHCLELDFSDSRLFAIVGRVPVGLEMLPVIYEEQLQRSLIRSGINRVIDILRSVGYGEEGLAALSQTERGVILGLLSHALGPFVIGFKHPTFAEEKEWRAVAICANTTTADEKKERLVGAQTVSYLECIFIQGDEEKLWQRPLLPLTGVIHGPRCLEAAQQELQTYLAAGGYGRQTAILSSRIPLKR